MRMFCLIYAFYAKCSLFIIRSVKYYECIKL